MSFNLTVYIRNVLKKFKKPNIDGDELLGSIDSAPYYQPIPQSLFNGKTRAKYLSWRNKLVSRCHENRNNLLDLKGKNVIDIGCNIGYLGWSNTQLFKSYLGIDADKTCIEAARKIAEEMRYQNIKFLHCDFNKFIDTITVNYDTCLLFSIYHHLLYQFGIDGARSILNKLSGFCNELYFDMGQKDEPSNPSRRAWHDLLPDEQPVSFIKKEVLDNTLFNHAALIGETEVGNSKRLLFKFTK